MSNDEENKSGPRTKIRRVGSSKVPDPPGHSRSNEAQRTQIRRVDRDGSQRDVSSSNRRNESRRSDYHSSESDQEQPSRQRDSQYQRSGPRQVRQPASQSRRTRMSRRSEYREERDSSGNTGRKLLDAASSLLALGGHLKHSDRPNNIEQLRSEILDAVNRYGDEVEDHYSERTVEDASFCVCAFLDDCVLGSIWSKGTEWAQGSVLAKVHGVADRSNLLPMLRENLERGPDPDLVALYHTVLSLGFIGSERSKSELSNLREQVYKELKRFGHEEQRELIDESMVVAEVGQQVSDRLPWWTILAASAALMLALFLGIQQLQKPDERAFAESVENVLYSHKRLGLSDFVPDTQVEPPPQVLDLSLLLAEDIDSQRVRLIKANPGTRIVIRSDGMFSTSSSAINESYTLLLDRIGSALEKTRGPIRVEGHTDNVPFRSAIRTNQMLSTERAQAVSRILVKSLSSEGRLVSRGRADLAPLVCNTSEDNLRKNRRVEIVLPEVETRNAEAPLSAPTCPA